MKVIKNHNRQILWIFSHLLNIICLVIPLIIIANSSKEMGYCKNIWRK